MVSAFWSTSFHHVHPIPCNTGIEACQTLEMRFSSSLSCWVFAFEEVERVQNCQWNFVSEILACNLNYYISYDVTLLFCEDLRIYYSLGMRDFFCLKRLSIYVISETRNLRVTLSRNGNFGLIKKLERHLVRFRR